MKPIRKYIDLLKESPMKSDLFVIFKFGAIMSAVTYLITLFWGFDLSMITGILLGYTFLVLSYSYLAITICSATAGTDKKKAKRKMFSCYLVRFAGLFLICWLSFETGIFNVIGVLLPQLFPRPALQLNHFIFTKRGNGNGRT